MPRMDGREKARETGQASRQYLVSGGNRLIRMDSSMKNATKEIEALTASNLPNAFFKRIIDHFKTNDSMGYSVLAPQRPGELIRKLRQARLRVMREEGMEAKAIAAATGLSESYFRKIGDKERCRKGCACTGC